MKKLKIGAEIKTKEEVKDLIIGIIENTDDEFAESWLAKVTYNWLQDSPLKLTEKQVAQIVEFTLYDLQMENKIGCDYGLFKKLNNSKNTDLSI